MQHWFNKRRSLANGIYMTGMSIGAFIWPPLTRWLIDLYSWQGALIVIGGLFLHGVPAALLLRPLPAVQKSPHTQNSSSGKKSFCLASGILIPLILYYIGCLFETFGHVGMYAYTPVRANHLGLENQNGALLISIIGITGLFARPLAGFIADRKGINRITMFGISTAAAGVLEIVSTSCTTFPTMIPVYVLFGVLAGKLVSIMHIFSCQL